jgi:hypothetical protein
MESRDVLVRLRGPTEFLVAFDEKVQGLKLSEPLPAVGKSPGGAVNTEIPDPEELLLSFKPGITVDEAYTRTEKVLDTFAEVHEMKEERQRVELYSSPDA